ncbi:MAG: protease SohB [Pseudomonadota bacterium]|nr:protease SohB [Pseudomonadota bacterium]
MEFLFDYGLFLAKALTLLAVLVLLLLVISGVTQRHREDESGHIEVKNVNETIDNLSFSLKQLVLKPHQRKREEKENRKRKKKEKRAENKDTNSGVNDRNRVFVIDFLGDIHASGVKSLREEVTAILSVARDIDEVLIRLESPGGIVHGYGLAASQLRRITNQGLNLTVAVDKVAASGGYMMACIGNRIIAAPFALLGSIGVVAQMPNFHRFLKNRDVDVEVLTAGKHKRTLTVFGENTDKGREKFVQELEDVHTLFKDFVSDNRPQVNIDAVSTGEAWYGTRAIQNDLVDELMTSDEFITNKCKDSDVFLVKYVLHKGKIDRLMERFSGGILESLSQRFLWP